MSLRRATIKTPFPRRQGVGFFSVLSLISPRFCRCLGRNNSSSPCLQVLPCAGRLKLAFSSLLHPYLLYRFPAPTRNCLRYRAWVRNFNSFCRHYCSDEKANTHRLPSSPRLILSYSH